MMFNAEKEIEILKNAGIEMDEIRKTYGVMSDMYVGNKQTYGLIQLAAAATVKTAAPFTPHFVRLVDGWGIKARGTDFHADGMINVRKRDGSYSLVEVINSVDRTSTEIKTYTLA